MKYVSSDSQFHCLIVPFKSKFSFSTWLDVFPTTKSYKIFRSALANVNNDLINLSLINKREMQLEVWKIRLTRSASVRGSDILLLQNFCSRRHQISTKDISKAISTYTV